MANCMGVSPGGVEAFQCLQRHSASLSAACRGAVAAITPKPAPAATPAAAPAPAATPATAPASPSAAPAPTPAAAPAAAPPSVAPAPAAPKQAAPAAPPPAKSAAAPPRQPTNAQRAAIRQACQADFISRCPGVQPGGAQALQCLQGHAPELSAGCRSALAAIGGAASASVAPAAAPAPAAEPPIGPIGPLPIRLRLEVLNLCRPERMQLCGGMPPGAGRILDCLVANQASISPGCRRALVWAATGQ